MKRTPALPGTILSRRLGHFVFPSSVLTGLLVLGSPRYPLTEDLESLRAELPTYLERVRKIDNDLRTFDKSIGILRGGKKSNVRIYLRLPSVLI
jgi:hypothetical protein